MNFKDRENAAIKSGIIGIACNVLLCTLKFFTGLFSSSVSVMADAFNNLSDATSNIITIAGAKISQKPDDREHPFGHGRMEYISSLIVAIIILLMGFELGKSSVEKIITPQIVNFSWWNLVILTFSVCIKGGMCIFNRVQYKKSGNINLKAVSQDSFNDCITTLTTILAILISAFTPLKRADGIAGVLVSIFVIFSGISILRETLNPLLGQPPSEETVDEIKNILLEQKLILGVHDLIIHNYGAGKIIASAHAEVPDNVDVIHLHDAIDSAEKEIFERMKIDICIHMDPVSVNNKIFEKYKNLTKKIIFEYNAEYKFHDFKIEKTENKKITLTFDLVIPFEKCEENHQEILKNLEEKFYNVAPEVLLNVKIEHSYV